MLLHYRQIDDAADIPRKTNVILADFTTAHAQTILYKNMQKVKSARNNLYCDTDSIMYIEVENQSEAVDIPIGTGLGEMTKELPKDVLIDTFWCAGPKFYSMSRHISQMGSNIMYSNLKALLSTELQRKCSSQKSF